MGNTKTWVLVASDANAKLYRVTHFPKIEQIHSFEHPESRLLNHELVSSKPGRNFDRTGTNRHSYEPKSDPQQLEAEKFAKEVSDYLHHALLNKEFDHLYLFAGPTFLGFLRHSLDPQVISRIKAEAAKDLSKRDKSEIESHIAEIDLI